MKQDNPKSSSEILTLLHPFSRRLNLITELAISRRSGCFLLLIRHESVVIRVKRLRNGGWTATRIEGGFAVVVESGS